MNTISRELPHRGPSTVGSVGASPGWALSEPDESIRLNCYMTSPRGEIRAAIDQATREILFQGVKTSHLRWMMRVVEFPDGFWPGILYVGVGRDPAFWRARLMEITVDFPGVRCSRCIVGRRTAKSPETHHARGSRDHWQLVMEISQVGGALKSPLGETFGEIGTQRAVGRRVKKITGDQIVAWLTRKKHRKTIMAHPGTLAVLLWK